jgi:hypothetical protein
VSGAFDVNGDGDDDLIVGAPASDPNGRLGAGESYVVFGRTTGFPAAFDLGSLLPSGSGNGSQGFVLKGPFEHENAGVAVSSAGDINGDGIDDIIIGADDAGPDDRPNAGESYVVFGRTTGFPPVYELQNLWPARL